MAITIFLPTRKGSERVANKNTRQFAGLKGGLLENKLHQLVKIRGVEEILLSTNDEACLEIGQYFSKKYKKLRIDKRPQELASSSTRLRDLIEYVPKIVNSEHILWTHVTSPFCNEILYEEAIKAYNKKGKEYDSLVSVHKFKNFLWDAEKKDIINRKSREKWPNTQDLQLLYEINSAIFLAPKTLYVQSGDRLGTAPLLFEMDKISSLDIDYEEDFKIAEAVYDKISR